jgi:hypothetical protein
MRVGIWGRRTRSQAKSWLKYTAEMRSSAIRPEILPFSKEVNNKASPARGDRS